MHTLTSAENKKTESKQSSHPPLAWVSTKIVLPRAIPGIQCPFKLIRIKDPTHTRRHIRASIRIHAIHSRFRIISQKTTHTHTRQQPPAHHHTTSPHTNADQHTHHTHTHIHHMRTTHHMPSSYSQPYQALHRGPAGRK